MRRDKPEWLNPSHHAVLHFLNNYSCPELVAQPKTITANLGFSKSAIDKAISKLLEEGYIERTEHGTTVYGLTETGRKYITGQEFRSE